MSEKSEKVIAFICGAIRCGRNKAQYQRVHGLSQHYRLLIITRKGVCNELQDEVDRVITFPGNKWYALSFLYWLWLIWIVLKFNANDSIDLVYTTRSPYHTVAGITLHLFGFHWIADLWDHPTLNLELRKNVSRGWGKLLLNIQKKVALFSISLLKYSDLLVVSLFPSFLRKFNMEPRSEEILCLTNGVDLDYTQSLVSKSNTISKNSNFRVVYVGSINEERGIENIISVAASLSGKINQFQLRLIGPVENSGVMERYIRENEIGSTVQLLGKVDHSTAISEINQGDICLSVLSTKWVENYDYAYPIKLFEYLALGKAIIASSTRAMSQVIEDGKTGLLVEPDNENELRKAILRLYNDSELRQELGENAEKLAKKYRWGSINNRIVSSINRIIV